MLKVKYSEMEQPEFASAINKLRNTPGQEIKHKTVFDFHKIDKCLKKTIPDLQETYKKVRDIHFEKDEENVYKTTPLDLDEWKAARAAWGEQELEIKSAPLPYDDCLKAGLTAGELGVLSETIMEEPKDKPHLKGV